MRVTWSARRVFVAIAAAWLVIGIVFATDRIVQIPQESWLGATLWHALAGPNGIAFTIAHMTMRRILPELMRGSLRGAPYYSLVSLTLVIGSLLWATLIVVVIFVPRRAWSLLSAWTESLSAKWWEA